MAAFYNTAIYLYTALILLLSPFHKKAGLWYRGRKRFFSRWKDFDTGRRKVVWFHCASLGEFEQGRPLIETIREKREDLFILLTFFSPSGYEIRKDYPLADAVCYLPADTPANARRFIGIFKPAIAVFVKYEFWHNYISVLSERRIPLYLVSAIFREDQPFFRWYGKWFGKILTRFSHIFVQDGNSLQLLESIGISGASVAGDTRFDRVHAIAGTRREIPVASRFSGDSLTIVAGSTWPPDEDLLVRFMREAGPGVKLIIAPHEIHEDRIRDLRDRFGSDAVRFSGAGNDPVEGARVLIIDNMGLLSSLYFYGQLAYVGGGFGKGIHNILEACTYGIPVIFGPNYRKFREARELAETGAAFPVENYNEFSNRISELLSSREKLHASGSKAKKYIEKNLGATGIIVDRILTSPGIH
jgi:3-deoxy-D-manno-octulosonic-acid transferase